MAQYWRPAGSSQTVKVQSSTSAPDMQAVAIETLPSLIYTVALVPLALWQSGHYAEYLDSPALLIEQLMGNDTGSGTSGGGLVTGAQYVNLQDANGLYAGFMDFTVSYQQTTPPGGRFDGRVAIPMTSLETFGAFEQPLRGGTPSELIQAEYDRLFKLAGS